MVWTTLSPFPATETRVILERPFSENSEPFQQFIDPLSVQTKGKQTVNKMDPLYNLLQEQLANINNNLNSGLSKLQEDSRQLARRIDQLESNDHALNDQVQNIRQAVDYLPKLYANQVGALETLLVGHQYQFRRLSSIVSRDNENSHFADPGNFHNNNNNNNNNGLSLPASLSQDENVGSDGSSDNTSARVANSSTDASSNAGLGINPSNSVNNPNSQLHRDSSQQLSNRNQVNIGLLSSSNPISGRSANSISSLRNFTSILPIDNEQNVLPINPNQHSGSSQDDGASILNNVQNGSNDNSGRIWDNVPFNRLNPNPKTVQEVLDEYYYGYQGQPPLKYLEEHRREWRKGNRNLSKTFCRRHRVITAVEAGTRLYMREYGITENIATERTINELENLRIKENGRKETMYWLFHHIPNHLKRR